MDVTITLTVIGLVVTIVIGAWQIYLARKQITKPNVTLGEEIEYKKRPYPKEITAEISKAPVLQQSSIAKSYTGIKVEWRATLYTIHNYRENEAELMLLDRGKYPWIYCSINIAKYPELKIAKEGHELWVMGEIAHVEATVIRLKNCKLKVDDPL